MFLLPGRCQLQESHVVPKKKQLFGETKNFDQWLKFDQMKNIGLTPIFTVFKFNKKQKSYVTLKLVQFGIFFKNMFAPLFGSKLRCLTEFS
jgi:hypothetical protein